MAKKYTREEIEGSRNWMRKNCFPNVQVDLAEAGLRFDYFVMPQNLCPQLPDFVYRCTGSPEDGYVFGISETVPEIFRPFAVAHEFMEFGQIGLDVNGRCLQALEKEIELVPGDIRPEYIKMRRRFFDNLVKWTRAQPDYDQLDIVEFEGSLARLNELVRGE
ncbi:MAG: hypothetical protein WC796_03840 [Candidatus Pacearchaeota archaeon]|jgi:hypothetical protein